MHEKYSNKIYAGETKIFSGSHDPILRDYLRRSGSPMVTSNSGGPHGLRNTKKVRQTLKRRRLNPMVYIHRVSYILLIVIGSAATAAIWG